MRLAVNKLFVLAVFVTANIAFISSYALAAMNEKSRVTFVAVGDMPYKDNEMSMLTAPNGAIVKAIKQLNPDVLVHFGDIKSGGTSCTDELLIERREQLFNLFPFKAVFAPGDNDWTDCDRRSLFERFNELERLDFLRKNYFSGDGDKLTQGIVGLSRQTDFIENASWSINNLVFGTINVPGTNNGRNGIVLGDKSKILGEADRRDKMNEQWLDTLFEQAKEANGLVITFQADIYQPSINKFPIVCSKDNRQKCDGYMKTRQLIEQKSARLNKPVLIIHGDTSAYCFHQPVIKQTGSLWRLNGLGDYSVSDAAQIVFDADNLTSPFTVVSLLGQKSLPNVCDYND